MEPELLWRPERLDQFHFTPDFQSSLSQLTYALYAGI